jgi:hypothetical protein
MRKRIRLLTDIRLHEISLVDSPEWDDPRTIRLAKRSEVFTYKDCLEIEKACRRQPSTRTYTKAEVEAEVNRRMAKAMGGSVPISLPSGSLDRAKARMDDVLTHGAAARHELDKIDFQGREVEGSDIRALNPATDATMPAAKVLEAHFTKQGREIVRELRKQLALERVDKSDRRTIGGVPAWLMKTAEVAQAYPQNMIPGHGVGLADTDPNAALERLKADPGARPEAPALMAVMGLKAQVLADPRKGWH